MGIRVATTSPRAAHLLTADGLLRFVSRRLRLHSYDMTLRPTPSLKTLQEPLGDRDHTIGTPDAPVSLVEYGDYECPHCARGEAVVRALLERFDGKLRYAFRNFPLVKLHQHARLAAEAAEAAAAQGKFFEMHRLLFENQHALEPVNLLEFAGRLGLDLDRFRDDLNAHRFGPRVQEDMAGALRSGVNGTPAFFINNQRHAGYELESLVGAIESLLSAPA